MARSDGSDVLPEKRKRLLSLQPELRKEYPHLLPDGVLLFRCRKCTTIYPLNHFGRNNTCRYGVQNDCRSCRSILHRTKAKTYLPDPNLTHKRCGECHTVKSIAEFATHCRRPDGYANTCRSCETANKNAKRVSRNEVEVAQYRREQTIRICAEYHLAVPGYDVKACHKCHHVLPLDDFPHDGTRSDLRSGICKACLYPLLKKS